MLSRSTLSPDKNGSRTEQRAKRLTPEMRLKLEAYSKLCRELGETESNVALAWILANPVLTAPVIGPRTLEQLNEILHAAEIELDENTLKKLDDIFPGPGGAAPYAYAW
jgi:aryl-alcohol dehydrogenase-like predicted oxidoreductase